MGGERHDGDVADVGFGRVIVIANKGPTHHDRDNAMESFFRTSDGRLRGMRIAGCLYLVPAAIDLIEDGWQSLPWIAALLFALGLFGMSAHEEPVHSRGSKWRSPPFVAGMAAALLGLGLMFYRLVARHLS